MAILWIFPLIKKANSLLIFYHHLAPIAICLILANFFHDLSKGDKLITNLKQFSYFLFNMFWKNTIKVLIFHLLCLEKLLISSLWLNFLSTTFSRSWLNSNKHKKFAFINLSPKTFLSLSNANHKKFILFVSRLSRYQFLV